MLGSVKRGSPPRNRKTKMADEKKSFGSWCPTEATSFIEKWEGRRLEAYQCAAGIWTIGVGHTGAVKAGDTCTNEQADEWLLDDIERQIAYLRPYVNVRVTRGQFVALASLAFNVGGPYVVHNCPKLLRALNAEDYDACAHEFLDVTKAGGRELDGLVRRRKAEAALFLGEE